MNNKQLMKELIEAYYNTSNMELKDLFKLIIHAEIRIMDRLDAMEYEIAGDDR